MRLSPNPRLLLLLLLAIAPAIVAGEDKPEFTLYLTSKVIDNQPTTEAATVFDCVDRIYLVFEATGLPEGKNQLTVRWLNPAGEQQERTEYDFYSQSFTRAWAWLQLSGPPGSALIRGIDPSFGMDEFIGDWQAKVLLDHELVETLDFEVIC